MLQGCVSFRCCVRVQFLLPRIFLLHAEHSGRLAAGLLPPVEPWRQVQALCEVLDLEEEGEAYVAAVPGIGMASIGSNP